MSLFSFSGQRPAHLGVKEGQLAACPSSPNCVSSQAKDAEHQIAPLSYSDSPESALSRIEQLIASMDNARIITATDSYLHAEFTSSLMGFVDDFECCLNPELPVIHVRSASRLGKSDLGVNRKRVETIRERFQ